MGDQNASNPLFDSSNNKVQNHHHHHHPSPGSNSISRIIKDQHQSITRNINTILMNKSKDEPIDKYVQSVEIASAPEARMYIAELVTKIEQQKSAMAGIENELRTAQAANNALQSQRGTSSRTKLTAAQQQQQQQNLSQVQGGSAAIAGSNSNSCGGGGTFSNSSPSTSTKRVNATGQAIVALQNTSTQTNHQSSGSEALEPKYRAHFGQGIGAITVADRNNENCLGGGPLKDLTNNNNCDLNNNNNSSQCIAERKRHFINFDIYKHTKGEKEYTRLVMAKCNYLQYCTTVHNCFKI